MCGELMWEKKIKVHALQKLRGKQRSTREKRGRKRVNELLARIDRENEDHRQV